MSYEICDQLSNYASGAELAHMNAEPIRRAAAVIEALAEALGQASWDLRFASREFAREGNKQAAALIAASREQIDAALAQLQNRSGGEG